MRGDFHIHSSYSDGSFSITELMKMGIEKGLDIIAITDHDVTKGVMEAKSKDTEEIKILVGLELSTERKNESIHVLGYFHDLSKIDNLEQFLKVQRENRTIRAHKIKELLKTHYGIDLNMDFVSNQTSITRGTIAEEIMKQGYPYSRNEIFEKMLGNGCPAYIPSTKLTTRQGVKIIHDCNGLAILAHPILYNKNPIDELIELGFDGIEAIYRSMDNPLNAKMIAYAKSNHLIITAGSDFHNMEDKSHGKIGDAYLEGEYFNQFLKKVMEVKY